MSAKDAIRALSRAVDRLAASVALTELNEDESRLTIGELWERFTSPDDTPHDSESVAKGLRFLRRYGLADAQFHEGIIRYTSYGMFLVPKNGDEQSPGALHIGHWDGKAARFVLCGPTKEVSE